MPLLQKERNSFIISERKSILQAGLFFVRLNGKEGTADLINSDVSEQYICSAVLIGLQAFSDGIAAASGRIHD